MPLATTLSSEEKAVISAHAEQNLSHTEIARLIGRHRTTISRYLLSRKRNIPPRKKNYYRKLSLRDERNIIRAAAGRKLTARKIKSHLNLSVSVRRIQQVLAKAPYLQWVKRKGQPFMKKIHKKNRLKWAKEMLHFGSTYWKRIIFSDEKKFNLDGPDGMQHYWHDIRNEPEVFSKRVQGGASVIVWGAVSYKGALELIGIQGTLDSEYYCTILSESLIPMATNIFGDNWTFMQDNASVHVSHYTKNWLEANDIDVLDWPAKSPDLNVIENVWGQLVRVVYENGKQYNSVEDLTSAISTAWSNICPNYIQKLYKSMTDRLVSVVEKKGGLTAF